MTLAVIKPSVPVPYAPLVTLCKELLAEAESGELRGLAFAASYRTKTGRNYVADDDETEPLIAQLAILQATICWNETLDE